jgi:hypothetical protein
MIGRLFDHMLNPSETDNSLTFLNLHLSDNEGLTLSILRFVMHQTFLTIDRRITFCYTTRLLSLKNKPKIDGRHQLGGERVATLLAQSRLTSPESVTSFIARACHHHHY